MDKHDKQELKHIIQRLKCDNTPLGANGMIHNNANGTDFQKILEMFCHSYDTELKTKILAFLGTYLLSKESNCKIIVTYRPLYEEIQSILSKGLTLRNTCVLYFVLALLSFDVQSEAGRSLVMFAQNALRVSGCLTTMAELFTRGMMYQDLWIALCRCVAEACRGCQLNQTFCSNLVPECVRKCLQGNMEACLILQSLLQDCDRNTQVFLNCKGSMIFTRETIHYDSYLELLNTIVQRSAEAAAIMVQMEAVTELRECLYLFGADSKIGQWATVILYHINKWPKDAIEQNKNESQEIEATKENCTELNYHTFLAQIESAAPKINESKPNKPDTSNLDDEQNNCDDTNVLIQNIFREMAYLKFQNQKAKNRNTFINGKQGNDFTNTIGRGKHADDTLVRLKDIVTEFLNKNPKPQNMSNKNEETRNFEVTKISKQTRELDLDSHINTLTNPYNISCNDNTNVEVLGYRETTATQNDYSFTFLFNQKKGMTEKTRGTNTDQSCFVAKPTMTTRQFSVDFRNRNAKISQSNSQTRIEPSSSMSRYPSNKDNDKSSKTYLHQFKPSFASTPKRKTGRDNIAKTFQSSAASTQTTSSKDFRYMASTSRSHHRRSMASNSRSHHRRSMASNSRSQNLRSMASTSGSQYRRLQPSRIEKPRVEKPINKSVASSIKKRQSMSARLFTAINESCTTFVKSVKGIFKGSNSQENTQKQNAVKEKENREFSCSFSFTDYMRKRDEMLANASQRTGENSVDTKKISCKTCDDTALLRFKFANDENLKETVKKLKYGINLYGCDFKKISKVLWPRDKCMTHQVLYQLYRKLLAK